MKTKALAKPESTALTLRERAIVAINYTKTEADLKALAAATADITTITNEDGRAQVHAALMVLVKTRTDVKDHCETARDDANKFAKEVIATQKDLIGLFEPEEKRLAKLRDDWDTAKEREKEARIAAELARVQALQARIDAIRAMPARASGKSAAHAEMVLREAEGWVIGADFEELAEQATGALTVTLEQLRGIVTERKAHEAEQAQIEADRLELKRLKTEQAERDRLEKIERDAEAKRQADALAAERVEIQRVAEQQRQAQAVIDAENARIKAANEKLERDQEAARKAAEPVVVPAPTPAGQTPVVRLSRPDYSGGFDALPISPVHAYPTAEEIPDAQPLVVTHMAMPDSNGDIEASVLPGPDHPFIGWGPLLKANEPLPSADKIIAALGMEFGLSRRLVIALLASYNWAELAAA